MPPQVQDSAITGAVSVGVGGLAGLVVACSSVSASVSPSPFPPPFPSPSSCTAISGSCVPDLALSAKLGPEPMLAACDTGDGALMAGVDWTVSLGADGGVDADVEAGIGSMGEGVLTSGP